MQISNLKVGIIGCGQLGLSIGLKFLSKSLPIENLSISYNGSPDTLKRIETCGLRQNIVANQTIGENCDLIFVTVPPSAIKNFEKISVKNAAIIVSCVAGHEIKVIEKLFTHPVYKIMPTSPESIEKETAICGIYPSDQQLENYLKLLGFELFVLNKESDFHYFTAMACLPAALLQLRLEVRTVNEEQIYKEAALMHFPEFDFLYKRMKTEVPENMNDAESLNFIEKMSTPGGITECVINSIKAGKSLIQSIADGIRKSQSIAKIID
jgi:pyrroline-5-carboxylate reductase